MVFVTVCNALNAKVSAFVAEKEGSRNVDECSLISKSRCAVSELELHESLDIRLDRAKISTICSLDDLDEFLVKTYDDDDPVSSCVEDIRHDNNSIYVYFSNLKAMGIKLLILDANLEALDGGVQKLNSNDTHSVGAGATVRTNSQCRFPGLLLCRSWHGLVPGWIIRASQTRRKTIYPSHLYYFTVLAITIVGV